MVGAGGRACVRTQFYALVRAAVARTRRKPRFRLLVELAIPLFLAPPLGAMRLLVGEVEVPMKTGVDRAVRLGDPFATKYAARLCTPVSEGGSGGIFVVAPANGLGPQFLAFVRRRFGQRPKGWPDFRTFNDSKAVDEYVSSPRYGARDHPPLCGAVVFDGLGGYTIRLNGTIAGNQFAVCGGVDTRRTTTGRNIDARATSQDWYLCTGFLSLQRLASEFLMEKRGERSWKLDLDIVPFPTPAYRRRFALSAAPELLGLSAVLIFAYGAGQVAGQAVAERELKLLEAMKLLGLKDAARFSAHVICVMPRFALYGLEFAVALSLGIFTKSDIQPLALFLVLAGLAIAALGLCASSFFEFARSASLAVVVGVFASSRLTIDLRWAHVLPPVALVQGLEQIVELETKNTGLQWSNMWDRRGSAPPMGEVIAILGLDILLYLALWVYFDRVIPHTWGVAALPWYRPWVTGSRTTAAGVWPGPMVTRKRVPKEMASIVEDTLPVACAVVVNGVRKEYPAEGRGRQNKVVAVRSLDLGMPEGEVLALLGHNGAGKSTTVGMLTGALQPTKGNISIYGCDVTRDPAEARRRLGVCPQHDVLFDDLTASEHLALGAALRGVDPVSVSAAAAEALLRDVGLKGALATGTPAAALSAGRRRALDVALAFVGDPRFIVLDEPTSGMDPFVRRTMWDLLKKHRAGRVLCLSTHYMDEAEMLGDQVCILSRGAVQCYGSPDWLKVKLGSGYMLTLTRAEGAGGSTEASAKNVLETMQKAVPRDMRNDGLSIASFAGNETVMRVPFRLSGKFPEILRHLDGQKAKLGYATLSVSATTLEELFLRLADGEALVDAPPTRGVSSSRLQAPPAATPASAARSAASPSPFSLRDAQGLEALMSELSNLPRPGTAGNIWQGSALLIKRWQSMQRNKRSLMCLCLLPVIFNCLGLASIAATFELDSPALELMGTVRDLNPALGKTSGPRIVVPYTTEGAWVGSGRRSKADQLMQAGVDAGLWDVASFLPSNRTLKRATSWRPLSQILQVEAVLRDGDDDADGGEEAVPGEEAVDMSKYQEMRDKGAPQFVIKAVMEKDGVPAALAERFLAPTTGTVASAPALAVPGKRNIRGRLVAGLKDRLEVSYDSVHKEVGLRLEFGRATLRVDTRRDFEQRRELALCAAGGPAKAAAAEEAAKKLDEATRKDLQEMQSGGAPTFAQRAYLEKARVAEADIDVLVASASPEAVPPESAPLLERCARWQAFGAALLRSSGDWQASRYGAFDVEGEQVAVFYNHSVFHSAPLFLGLMQRAAVAATKGPSKDKTVEAAAPIRVVNWPLPLTEYQRGRAFSTQGFSFFTMALIGAAFLPAALVADLSRELCGGAVRQQLVAGMPMKVFIISSFLADTLLTLPPLLSQLWFVHAFELAVFVDELPLIAILLVGFAFASTAQVYALLPDYKNPASDQNSMLALNVVTGFILALITWILLIPFLGEMTNFVGRCVSVVGRLSPAFNLANALLTIPNTALSGFSKVYGLNALDWRVAGEPLFALVVNAVVYLLLALRRGAGPEATVDLNAIPAPRPNAPALSSEVEAEEKAALQAFDTAVPNPGLVLKNLAVSFPASRARATRVARQRSGGVLHRICDRLCRCWRGSRGGAARTLGARGAEEKTCTVGPLCVMVPPGEVLGLLGVSGSGKSLVLSALAGALAPSARVSGRVLLAGRQLVGSEPRPGDIGYCPQDDGLSHGLTVTQQVRLFGRLRGLRGRGLFEEVGCLVRALDLGPFEFVRIGTLSGGNHRKVQCACALVGSPRLICLDEPSTGLDPVARRSLWSTVQAKLRAASAVVIATKSIAEAEALCSKLGILNKYGQLSTIGTAHETRSRYGGGHELRANLKRPTMTEVFDATVDSRDPKLMAGFLDACVQSLGGSVRDPEGLMAMARDLVSGVGAVRKPYAKCLQDMRSGAWAEGLSEVEVDISQDLLPEDSAELQRELERRSKLIMMELRSLFPSMQCVEAVSLTRVYQLHDKRKWNLADVFQNVEDRKNKLRIADYSITQASLEHVFNQLAAKDQETEASVQR